VSDVSAIADVWAELVPPPDVPEHAPRKVIVAPANEEAAYQRPLVPIEWANDIVFDAAGVREIVEDVLTAGGMSVVYGESNSGKTTLLLDLALRTPAGLPWLGKRVEAGAVIYVAAESPASVRLRLEAFRRHHGVAIGDFGLIPTALSLLDPSADVQDLIELILREQDRLDREVRFVGVDTAARVMAGADENKGEDMSRLIGAGDRIREATGAHVSYVHHSGKDTTKGARGHSSLRAAVDTEIEVTADPSSKVHTLQVTKQRDLGSNGLKLMARFTPIELGRNGWGNPITACVAERLEEPSAHIQAVMKDAETRRCEEVVLAGFSALLDMGIAPTDGASSPEYLPKQLLEKSLAAGFDKRALANTLNRLMAKKVFRRSEVGRYGNRNPRFGLVLVER
jgi:hypothetical protein